MLGIKATATTVGSLAMTLLFTGNAGAAPVEVFCPPTLNEFTGQTRQYSLTTDPASTCYAYGGGNLNGQSNDAFQALVPGWDFEGQNNAFSSTGSLTGGSSGDWTILNFDPNKQYAVGVKDGGSPKWAVFLLPVGCCATGEWGVTSPQGGLSHLALYSRDAETPVEPGEEPIVPEPATVALLGLGLVAGGARMRRAKSRA